MTETLKKLPKIYEIEDTGSFSRALAAIQGWLMAGLQQYGYSGVDSHSEWLRSQLENIAEALARHKKNSLAEKPKPDFVVIRDYARTTIVSGESQFKLSDGSKLAGFLDQEVSRQLFAFLLKQMGILVDGERQYAQSIPLAGSAVVTPQTGYYQDHNDRIDVQSVPGQVGNFPILVNYSFPKADRPGARIPRVLVIS